VTISKIAKSLTYFVLKGPNYPQLWGKLLVKFKDIGSTSANEAAEIHDTFLVDSDSSQCVWKVYIQAKEISAGDEC
jgi:hypothetical protein